jgi:hypothetical protein
MPHHRQDQQQGHRIEYKLNRHHGYTQVGDSCCGDGSCHRVVTEINLHRANRGFRRFPVNQGALDTENGCERTSLAVTALNLRSLLRTHAPGCRPTANIGDSGGADNQRFFFFALPRANTASSAALDLSSAKT